MNALDLQLAFNRARIFASSDYITRDSNGYPFEWGRIYRYQNGDIDSLVEIAGLDLRTHGWVFGWDRNAMCHGSFPADRLTKGP